MITTNEALIYIICGALLCFAIVWAAWPLFHKVFRKLSKHYMIIVSPNGIEVKKIKYKPVVKIGGNDYILDPNRRYHLYVKGFANEVEAVQALLDDAKRDAEGQSDKAVKFIPSKYFSSVYRTKVVQQIFASGTTMKLIIALMAMNIVLLLLVIMKLFSAAAGGGGP
ncbi:MAG: hypothetical protein ACXQS5_03880 [Candidatus Methanospirareceae archaeon]